MPNIPSPRQGECKDRSAMGLLRALLERLAPARDAQPTDEWHEGAKHGLTSCETFVSRRIAKAALNARNVDKQRRRLLAERLTKLAADATWDAYCAECIAKNAPDETPKEAAVVVPKYEAKAARLAARASKLRTIAAGLRYKP